MLVSSNVSPDALARSRPHRRRLPRARRACRRARLARRHSKRWPGGGTSGITARRGRSCGRSITRGGSRARCVQLAGARHADRQPARRSIATSCSTCRSPMRRSWRWIRCRGAAISAACRGRAICRSSNTSARCARSATTACCRSRYSTTGSAPARRRTSRSTACARSTTCCEQVGAARPDRRVRLPGNRVHRVLRERGRGDAARPDAADAGIRADASSRAQGGDALAPGRHQPRRQLRARRIRAFL